MSEEPKPRDKRIVSKEEFAVAVSKREAKRWGSLALTPVIAICFLGVIFSAIGFMVAPLGEKFWYLLSGGLCFVLGRPTKRVAEQAMQEALTPLDVVPLTRDNIGNLPAVESLVRASQEPERAEEELLRASQYAGETPPEQLLRATPEHHQEG